MEYMSVKGSIVLKQGCLLERLQRKVLAPLETIDFINPDGIVTSRTKHDRLWLLGEGLMQNTEANRLIGLVRLLSGYTYRSCTIDIQRFRWELHIILGHEHLDPSPAASVCELRMAS